MFYLLKIPIKKFIQKKRYLTVSPEISFGELLKFFRGKNQTFAVFLKEGKPVGIITERDVLRAFHQRYPLEFRAFNLASKELVKIKSSANLFQAFNLMAENFIRRLIVTDEEGNLEGVITQEDLILHSSEEIFKGEARVRDFLENKLELIYATKDETIAEAIEKLMRYNIGVLPILDENFRPVGILSEKDMVQYEYTSWNKKLGEIALKEIITIPMKSPVTEAIRLFKKFPIRHLVVIDENGKAINVLSQRDFVHNLTVTYTQYLESIFKQAKEFISILPEIVLEFSECDSECRLTWMNEFAKQNFGETLLEKDVYSIFDFDDWNRIYGILKREKTVVNEDIKDRQGRLFELTGTYFEIGERYGKIKLLLRDRTDDFIREKTYQEEIKLLKSFLNNSLDYIFVINPEGKIIFANEAFKRALGYEEREILSKTIFDIVEASEDEIKRNIELLIKKGLTIRGKRFYRDAYNNQIPVEILAQAYQINGETIIVINARDMREIWQEVEVLKKQNIQLESFYSLVNELNLAKDENQLFQILERFLLKRVETFHYFEIEPVKTEVKSTYLSGNKKLWKDCMEREIKNCMVFTTGKSFVKRGEISCSNFSYPEFYHICLPLVFEGVMQGIINLIKSEPFGEEEVKFFEDITQTFNIYLHKLRLFTNYYEQSIKDPLLGIYNRGFMLETLKKESEKAKRIKKPFSIVLMDLDHFKEVNDTYGHLAGDLVLKEFVSMVQLNIREMDIFGRWGGEEFLLILPGTEKNSATIVAERIRERLEDHEFYITDRDKVKVTASFGVAEFLTDAFSYEFLLKIADERLYLAKALGRNRVVSESVN